MLRALQGSDRTSVRLYVGRRDYQAGKASPNVKLSSRVCSAHFASKICFSITDEHPDSHRSSFASGSALLIRLILKSSNIIYCTAWRKQQIRI